MSFPVALTIAGSDSGGGAGIQTDLRTFTAMNVYGCAAITAITSQNPEKVSRIDAIPIDGILSQIQSVLSYFPIQGIKTGMLFNAETIIAISNFLKNFPQIPLIVDPVMISTSGSPLLKEDAVTALKEHLFPLADWITPNVPELMALLNCSKPVHSHEYQKLALDLARHFNVNVILKGGHSEDDLASDYVVYNQECWILSTPRLTLPPLTDHGSGCTFAAAIVAQLAQKKNFPDFLIEAKSFLYGALKENIQLDHQKAQMFPSQKNWREQVIFQKV